MADGGYNLFTATYSKMTPLGMVAGHGFDFAKPVINSLKIMPLRFLRFGAFPPYYGDEINIGFWSHLSIPIGERDGSDGSDDSTIKIVCIGDSLTYGAGVGPGTTEDPTSGSGGVNWPDEWANISGFDIINKGINGNTSGEMLARFSDDVIALHPNYCIIECGTNDAARGIPISECKANIRAMVELCLNNNIKPRFAHYIQRNNQMQLALTTGLYTFDPDFVADYLEEIWEYEQTFNFISVLFNDYTDIDENNTNMSYFYNTLNDYIHPNADGYMRWAQGINLRFLDLTSFKPFDKVPKIAVIGSSLSSGVPYTDLDCVDPEVDVYSWTNRLRVNGGYTVLNASNGGGWSDQMLVNFNDRILSKNPDYCVLELCINDYLLFGSEHLSTSKSNVLAMLNLCETNDIIPIVVVAIPRPNQDVFQPLIDSGGNIGDWIYYQTEIKSYIESLGYKVLPYFDAIDSSSNEVNLSLTVDNGHPTADGYRMIGDMLYRLLPSYFNLEEEQVEPPTIVVIGSSLTAPHPSVNPEYPSWTDRFAEVSGYTVINKGIDGNNTSQMIERFWTDVISNHPDYCIMEVGINDNLDMARHPLDTIKPIVHTMLNLCLINNIKPIFLVCKPPYNTDFAGGDYATLDLARDRQAELMSYIESLGYTAYPYEEALEVSEASWDLGLTFDNIRPNSQGNKLIGERLYSYFDDLEKTRTYNYIQPEAPVVVVIGDSITAGTPYTDNKPGDIPNDNASWTAKFRALSGYTVINQAIGGTTMVDTEARFMTDVVALHPDYCIIENGNDVGFGISNFNRTANAIDSIIDMCEENDIKLIFVQPVARFNMVNYTADPVAMLANVKYWHMMHEYETTKGYPSLVGYYTPISTIITDDVFSDVEVNINYLVDGVHPTLDGYEIVGDWLTPQLILAMSEVVEVEDGNNDIYTLIEGYTYIYNLSKRTFTIYDENQRIIFYKEHVYTLADMQIDFSVHKSHQFEIVIASEDLNDWDFIPTNTKPQEYTAGEMEVADKGVHNIYLVDKVRPYSIIDADNPAWRVQHIGNLVLGMLGHIEIDDMDLNHYMYEFQKEFTGLLEVNESLYDKIATNTFYSVDFPWASATRVSSNSKGKLLEAGGLLLPSWSLSLYPALNIVIRLGEVFNNRAVYEPWLIYGLKFIWNFYTEDPIDPFPIDVLDLSPSWD